jgi:putative salt-induced outer membrane protein YdiY
MLRCVRSAAVAASLLLLTSAGFNARADEVRFKNGDKLTGTIVDVQADKLKIKSAVAGTITVDMKDVDTFSTDKPAEVHLKDGTVVNQPVVAAPGGNIQPATAPAAPGVPVPPAAVAPIPLSQIEAVNPGYNKWSGSLTIGGLVTRGNSDTSNLNIAADAMHRRKDDRFSLAGGYFFGRESDPDTGDKSTTVDNWFGSAKYDYFFSKKMYGYGLVRVEHDAIADLNLRVSPGAGVGYQWHESPIWNFSTEVGLAWVYEDYSTGGTDDHVAARLAYHYDRKLNDKVSFINNVEYLPSLRDTSDYNLNADAGLRATLSGNMFADFKFEWRYDATPAPGSESNDLRYVLGVGWTF